MTARLMTYSSALRAPVLVTLTEGEPAWEHSSSGATDEGWHSEWERFTLDGDRVLREWGSDGRDCDGRLSRSGSDWCPVDRLAALVPYQWEQAPETAPYRLPDWQSGERRQRDYNAEAAGY